MIVETMTLQVGATLYEGWKDISVSRGIEQLSGAFQFICADRWALQGQALPALKNQPCEVQVNGTTIIKGFIDSAAPRYSARRHDLVVRGRDATGDLADSSADLPGEGSMGQSLVSIAKQLCKPFGVTVTVDKSATADADEPFAYQHLQIGETIQESLLRLARIRGVLLVSDGQGGLLITRAGTATAVTKLVLGDNILEAEGDDSCEDRYHEYRVIAQDREGREKGPDSSQQIVGRAYDAGARSPRLLIIDPVDACDTGRADKLAAWTCAQRRAAGERVRYKVRGWLDGDRPWQPNTLVTVVDPWARFDGEYLIVAARPQFSKDEGRVTWLEVGDPAAFQPLKLQETDHTGGDA